MSAKLRQRVDDVGAVAYVTLSGVLDEDNELASLSDKLRAQTVVLLLGRLERINDAGAQAFSSFLDAVADNAKLVLVECSPAVVGHLNGHGDVGAGLIVKSFAAPYFCPDCDEPRTVVSEVVDVDGVPSSPPVTRCIQCDYVMQFDDDPKAYFGFLEDRPERIDPTLEDQIAQQLISADDDSTAPGFVPSAETIPRAPRRAPTVTGPVERVANLPAWVIVAGIVTIGAVLAYFLFWR